MGLKINNVGRVFNGKAVVRNISFEAAPGEIIGLLGKSGCGKSTVLRAVSGLDNGYEGTVEINGTVSGGVDKSTGFIFQEPRLMPWLNALENVTFGLKGSKEEQQKLGRKYLTDVGLAAHEELYPKELSGGMAQRVAIARALITSPEVRRAGVAPRRSASRFPLTRSSAPIATTSTNHSDMGTPTATAPAAARSTWHPATEIRSTNTRFLSRNV